MIYLIDNNYNRVMIYQMFGQPISIHTDNVTYIELDIETLKWRSIFTYEYLYMDQPVLTDINVLIRNYKIDLLTK